MAENQPVVGKYRTEMASRATGLAFGGPYGPFIITGHRSGQKPNVDGYLPIYRLWLVREGLHQIETKAGKFVLRAGQSLLIHPGGEVQFVVSGRSSWVRIDFELCYQPPDANAPAQMQPSTFQVFGIDLPWEIPKDLREDCRQNLERMSELWWRSPIDLLEANVLLSSFLVRLLRHTSKNSLNPPANSVIDIAETWIWEHLEQRPTITAMAKAVAMNRTYFSEMYRKSRGRTPQAFLDDLRIRRAKDLLRQTNLSIAEIAARSGYGNAIAFSRRFRFRCGVTPSVWRTDPSRFSS